MSYEVPLSGRDREDDVLFKDFDDHLSDDSSGVLVPQTACILHLHNLGKQGTSC